MHRVKQVSDVPAGSDTSLQGLHVASMSPNWNIYDIGSLSFEGLITPKDHWSHVGLLFL